MNQPLGPAKLGYVYADRPLTSMSYCTNDTPLPILWLKFINFEAHSNISALKTASIGKINIYLYSHADTSHWIPSFSAGEVYSFNSAASKLKNLTRFKLLVQLESPSKFSPPRAVMKDARVGDEEADALPTYSPSG